MLMLWWTSIYQLYGSYMGVSCISTARAQHFTKKPKHISRQIFFWCVCVCVCVLSHPWSPQSKPLERLNVKMVSFQLAVVAVAVVTSARHVEKKCDHMPRRWFIVMKIVGLEPKNIQASVLCHVMQSLLPLSKLKGGLILSQWGYGCGM